MGHYFEPAKRRSSFFASRLTQEKGRTPPRAEEEGGARSSSSAIGKKTRASSGDLSPEAEEKKKSAAKVRGVVAQGKSTVCTSSQRERRALFPWCNHRSKEKKERGRGGIERGSWPPSELRLRPPLLG